MISNLFAITLEPLLERPLNNKGPGNEFEHQKFELIYSDSQDINKRRPYAKTNLYPIAELSQFTSKKAKKELET